MNHLKHARRFAAVMTLAVGLVLAGCGTRTSVSGAWERDGAHPVPFGSVLVVGVSPNSRVRRSFELALVEAIATRDTKAFAAVQTAESQPELTRDIVASMVRSTGAEAVLVTRLASRKVAAAETAARTGVKARQPANLNGGVGLVELFSLEYHEYEEPGEFSAQATAIIETSVYDARNEGQILYTLTTTADYREDRDDVILDVTRAIAGKLRQEGLIR
ncbi:MAG: hypothetical protein IT486_07700 [Gammaproteobacteria bacterium]|nr:hypothetical protein [Gammaproteobacteria bacterium]